MFMIEEICACTQGTLLCRGSGRVAKGVSTDTRTLRAGDLFVALKGKNFDGHKFVSVALGKKVRVIIVSQKISLPDKNVTVIYVEDTLRAYCALARYHRERFAIPIIALTGSAGKTTTKEFIAKVLSQRFCVLKNFQTENNEIGVAKTLLQLRARHQLAILEFGTNHFGEIKRLTLMAQPTTVLLTNIGESHLEFLKNKKGVFKEKSDIFRYAKRLEHIFYNADDRWLRRIGGKRNDACITTFSVEQKSHCQAKRIAFDGYNLSFFVGRERFHLKAAAYTNIYNALAAIALGRKFLIPGELMRKSLGAIKLPQGRWSVKKINGRWIIDDTYNANPTSVDSALKTLAFFSSAGKKFFVFGDMLELGAVSRLAHKKIGALSVRCGINFLLTCGRWARYAAIEARKKGVPALSFASHGEIARSLARQSLPGDVILVKGSRGMRMEQVIEKLKANHF